MTASRCLDPTLLLNAHRPKRMVPRPGVFEAANLLEQQRQGVITRQLAAWAAIFAVPTAIAGIYGMNFANMPELKTDYGYFIVLGVIALLCSGLYVRFKKARWL